MFGSIALISATYVYLFIIFGAFLVRSGAGMFIVDLARAMAGRFVGGPGFVAVFRLGADGNDERLCGRRTRSRPGSSPIPPDEASGLPASLRGGGRKSAASTGGMIMPPIMGAGGLRDGDIHPDLVSHQSWP